MKIIQITKDHLDDLKDLVAERDGNSNFDIEDFYYGHDSHGLTILVYKNKIPIAIASFSRREISNLSNTQNYLYWENLYVRKGYRDGIAYINIIQFIKQKIKQKYIDGVYCAVHRNDVIKLHKISGFKNLSTIGIKLGRLDLKIFPRKKSLNIFFWSNPTSICPSDLQMFCDSLNKYKKEDIFTNFWTAKLLRRQIRVKGNRSTHIIKYNKKIGIYRIIKILPLVKLIIPVNSSDIGIPRRFLLNTLPPALYFHCQPQLITSKKSRALNIIRTYELIAFSETDISIKFNLIEHDAI